MSLKSTSARQASAPQSAGAALSPSPSAAAAKKEKKSKAASPSFSLADVQAMIAEATANAVKQTMATMQATVPAPSKAAAPTLPQVTPAVDESPIASMTPGKWDRSTVAVHGQKKNKEAYSAIACLNHPLRMELHDALSESLPEVTFFASVGGEPVKLGDLRLEPLAWADEQRRDKQGELMFDDNGNPITDRIVKGNAPLRYRGSLAFPLSIERDGMGVELLFKMTMNPTEGSGLFTVTGARRTVVGTDADDSQA